MPARLLAVEVGNSRAKCGLFEAGRPEPLRVIGVAHADDPAPAVRGLFREYGVEPASVRAALAGVNPAGAAAFLARWPPDCGPPPAPLPRAAIDARLLNIARRPDRVGTDRLLNALAAAELFRTDPAPPAVAVADCGTATTVDLVLPPGRRGGRRPAADVRRRGDPAGGRALHPGPPRPHRAAARN